MIDIIIPAHNAHKTICDTLASIALQDYYDSCKVYIIDDCSKKGYTKEIEKFSHLLSIKEIRLDKNMGPGYARQYGIEHSNSEYIIFIDADDKFFDCYAIKNLYNEIHTKKLDVVTSSIIEMTESSFVHHYNHFGCLHGKIYRRSFLNKYNIKFNDTRSSEDNAFNQLVFLCKPRHEHFPFTTYLYCFNDNSITKKDYENYRFYSLEHYTNNMLWAIHNSENKKINNKKEIAELLYSSIIYLYTQYLYHINKNNVDLILKWAYELCLVYYNSYEEYLSEEEKFKLIQDKYLNLEGLTYELANPPISLLEFQNKILCIVEV